MFLSTAIKSIQRYQIDTRQNRCIHLDTDPKTEFANNHMEMNNDYRTMILGK